MAGGLLGFMDDQPQQPENQAVLDLIAQNRAWWDSQNGPGSGQGPYKGNEYFEAAAQPGMSGYFDAIGGNIVPKVFAPQQVAAENGQTLGQLAGSIFPGGSSAGQIGYNIPEDASGQQDGRGGFFTLQDLFNLRQGGAGVAGVPSIGTFGQSLPSTNNWRLLGRGPGWIMRNGQLINTLAPETTRGGFIGADMGNPGSAEQGPMGLFTHSDIGTGAWGGMPNNWRGATGWPGQASPYMYDRWPYQTNV